MDPDSLPTEIKAPRKVKFAPKAPPKKEQNLVLPKDEKYEIDEAQAQQLLGRLNEARFKEKVKFERKTRGRAQVAFGFGGSSTSIRSFGVPKSINNQSDSDGKITEKEYKEPWDYYTNYPVTLPLRRPYSGNPELLDEEEFGEDREKNLYDEYASNCATDLGFMDDNLKDKMFFLQLPPTLPATKHPTNAEGHDQVNCTKKLEKKAVSLQKPCTFDELPEGFMGKLLVYRSGAVKLKLGDTLYDVSSGVESLFAQDVVAINTKEKHCCNLGELNHRAVITPDIDSILDSMSDL